LLKVACSGPGVSRTRNLSVTSPILYHHTVVVEYRTRTTPVHPPVIKFWLNVTFTFKFHCNCVHYDLIYCLLKICNSMVAVSQAALSSSMCKPVNPLYSAEAIIVPRRIMRSWYHKLAVDHRWVDCIAIWYSEDKTGRGGGD